MTSPQVQAEYDRLFPQPVGDDYCPRNEASFWEQYEAEEKERREALQDRRAFYIGALAIAVFWTAIILWAWFR